MYVHTSNGHYVCSMHYVPGKQKGEHWHKVCLPNTILVFFDNRVRWSIKKFVEVCGDNMPFGLIHLSDIKMRRKGGYSVYSNENVRRLVWVWRRTSLSSAHCSWFLCTATTIRVTSKSRN